MSVIADDDGHGPEEDLQDSDIKLNIIKWLEDLNPKQREVLARRFGLLGYEPSTLEDVGVEIGLTRERVRQIQVEALRRLKDMLGHKGLDLESLFNKLT
jgi:RNA polymerase nonessential primary-like sigma factor